MIIANWLRPAVLAGIAGTCTLALVSACGAQDAPSCSSAQTETLVGQAIATSNPSGPMRWGVPFRLPDNRLGVAMADINLPAFAKAMGFKFSGERERGYDQATKKRSCTAEVSASWSGADPASLFSVQPAGLAFTWEQENHLLAAALKGARDQPSNAVQFDGITGVFADGMERGTRLDFDANILAMLKGAFAISIPRYIDRLKWERPLDYSVQLIDKGGLFVTLNE